MSPPTCRATSSSWRSGGTRGTPCMLHYMLMDIFSRESSTSVDTSARRPFGIYTAISRHEGPSGLTHASVPPFPPRGTYIHSRRFLPQVSQHEKGCGAYVTPESNKKAKINGPTSKARLFRVVGTTWQHKIRLQNQTLDPTVGEQPERATTHKKHDSRRPLIPLHRPRTSFSTRGDTKSRFSIFPVNETPAPLQDSRLPNI